jgi:soluble lytic murein transglycosylase-like protein
MAFSKVTVKIPEIKKVYSTFSRADMKQYNKDMLQEIMRNYGGFIHKFSDAFELPYGVVAGFIATESNGKQSAISLCCPEIRGLMQVSPAAVYDCSTKWSKQVDTPLPAIAIAELNKMPEILQKKNYNSIKSKIVTKTGGDASFNIMAGCMTLRWCIEKFSTNISGGQLNKALIAYNYGANRKVITNYGKNVVDTTTLYNDALLPKESKSYLVKMLGVDGFLSLVYKENVI